MLAAPISTLFPYTTLFRSQANGRTVVLRRSFALIERVLRFGTSEVGVPVIRGPLDHGAEVWQDRKSTRLNSSHVEISYAVFCLKKKRKWGGIILSWARNPA